MTTDVCEECVDHLAKNPNIIGACASVGIEHAASTERTVQSYMRSVHRREGHS